MKYNFGYSAYSRDAVEIPMLDAFKAELDALCKRYGVSFEHEKCSDDFGSSSVKLVPYNGAPGDLFDSLGEAERGIPWMDAARAEYDARTKCRDAAQEEARRAEAREREMAREAAALENGVTVGLR